MIQDRSLLSAHPREALIWILKLPVHVYRLGISPLIGPRCRYQPTCSAYALEALDRHGPIKGLWLAVCRIVRCHPFGGSGYDPVPDPAPSHSSRPRTTG